MKLVIGITGASGSLYGVRLLEELAAKRIELHLILTEKGEDVLLYETRETRFSLMDRLKQIRNENSSIREDIFLHTHHDSLETSLSWDAMIIIPCSRYSLTTLARGALFSLLGQAAERTLQEGKPLMVVPRETPLSRGDLEAMLSLTKGGAVIFPACPPFYSLPVSVDDMVNAVAARILAFLNIESRLAIPQGLAQNFL
jgi:4-hydroxy-3-polyprenylbenzoate decarboxylase